MCNLYRMTASVDEIARMFDVAEGAGANIPPLDAIYPKTDAPIVRQNADGKRTLARISWGVPPPASIASTRPITNVRNLGSNFWKPMLADPARRCLVPLTSFCEWTGNPGAKRKIWFALKDRPLFAFAGIWQPTGEGDRFAFLTCAPNDTVGAVHPKAMPVILRAEDHGRWLSADYDEACALARPYPDHSMAAPQDDDAAQGSLLE
jgi:putative SOS response-associated peptidase YedK